MEKIRLAEIARRTTLEMALLDYAPADRETAAAAFLAGLSVDELGFLAEFLGSCILISSAINLNTQDAFCYRAHAFHRGEELRPEDREDIDHKLILLSEFAICCGFLIKFA
jgi:hypothetical protein